MAKIKNLSEILPPELQEAQALPLDEWIDKPLVIRAARDLVGSNGNYARICVSTPDDDSEFFVATGASQPMEVLHWAKEQRQFPFLGKFIRAGRAILLTGVD